MTRRPGGEPVIDRLLAAAVLTPAEASVTTLHSETRTRYIVDTISVAGAPRFVVKHARSHDVVPLLACERRALLAVAGAGVPSVAPAVATNTGDLPMLVVTHLASADEAGQSSSRDGTAVAETLARLHRATQAMRLLPGHGPDGHDGSVVPTLLFPRLTALADAPETAASLAFLRANWRPGVLIHGDVKWEHVRRHAALIDWELAGRGDPAWDVGALLHELCIEEASPARLGAVLQAYQEAIGRPLRRWFLQRCRAALAVRCVQSVDEYRAGGADARISARAASQARWWATHPGALEHCLAEAA